MTLRDHEGWNMPADHGFYPALPAIYRNVKMQLVFFHALPNSVATFLPEPLIPTEAGLCLAGGIDVPFCTNYGSFQESFIMMQCQFGNAVGFYCSHVFHNGPTGIAAGREIYGTPKVFADVRVRYPDRTMLTETLFNGASILTVHSSLEEVSAKNSIPSLTPAWRLKVIPRADGPGPAIKQLIDCTGVTQDLTRQFLGKGHGVVSLGTSPGCDLTRLGFQAAGDAFYQECSYSEGYAEIVYDYLQKK